MLKAAVSDDVRALHESLLTLDSHIDIPWPDRDDAFLDTAGRCVDFPKMRRGHLAAGCFVAYIAQDSVDADGHAAAQAQTLEMLAAIDRMQGERNGLKARVCDTVDKMEDAFREGVLVVMPGVENGYGMGDDIGMLARFRALGARYVTLTHNGHNALADSGQPSRKLGDPEARHGGLSALGRAAIAEMNRLGMVVDVSHTSRDTMLQAVEVSATPVAATHACVRALCDHPRNLDDAQLDALKASGGVIQITAVGGFLRPRAELGSRRATVADYMDHLDYVVRRIGPEHVGISSDFDGGGELDGWRNAGESLSLTAELVSRGYDRSEIEAFWGGNFRRVLRAAERAATAA
ncbi:dipeptidase [Acetobacter nitrogenifigens DSM 23921 = NBRC 105050]|uniref:Membrane dipeptidase n=1 Tax=Acetobacter nitrogenifigens DSM 23921 = NBRC 105050 TaxID=1120919 RepID=A0A511XCC4_9PROT|nr:dipeptidase [Acetobacter nitrogenifigens]GBQ94056.1 dipeptidase [Acetobacter nitrogenifigens DSM 23921 = NBRC 105050]GEN60582.1 membrane dipeptidase [Acetobacter nitrogenifigens DSM 23921 = NBRC 105050]